MTSLKFGTSGLRGLVGDILGAPARAYTKAFLDHLDASPSAGSARTLLVGRDLRSSSPRIAGDCMAAARAAGWTVVDCGALPTPALALEALRLGAPAIMVTGSHIPDDRNGLKFYTAEGEITKADEDGILGALGAIGTEPSADAGTSPGPDPDAIERYRERYLAAFGPDYLSGLRIGVYQHSTVARDVLVAIVEALGATAVPFARSDLFIPVDTEAHRVEDIEILAAFAAGENVDAIVSADGDADRPLVADASGRILRGDTLGLITALALGASVIVTPVTSASRIEAAAAPLGLRRTRVGSPFVLAGMAEAAREGGVVIGFEANGGVLLGTPVTIEDRVLDALPTRDAVLPIVATLGQVRSTSKPLAEIVAGLGLGFTAADRLKAVPSEIGARLAARLLGDAAYAASFFAEIGPIASVDRLDGARFLFEAGEMVHYRPSGNAPELRCYVEAESEPAAAALLSLGLAKAARFVEAEVAGEATLGDRS